MVITLIGMKHCGKSTLGAALAQHWHCAFHDLDRVIEELATTQSGKSESVREIFARKGAAAFAEWESRAVRHLHQQLKDHVKTAVIAVGGRTALNQDVSHLLTELGTVVYLEVDVAECFARVQRRGLPPFLDPQNPERHFRELFAERAPHYQHLAQLTVNITGLDKTAAFEKLRRAIDRADQTSGS
jgi:shikimate kinase